ncbi:glyoxalase/bleomycin resistance protein/dioxygenase [Anabaenopsis circularis NIES-21]|uniref:Glyoxalase/bleomycin resistance protein/dioxygenase n=1 Tax=Anabaenopsis circularis NIES-21 TaxID=1085406 RepID=A0A1Z4GIF3_9CYAN|nr:glyoxalase/bleomycin resistance protein/dioxygenase [Anabaenopsis circularis NIES-21]
MVLRYTEVFVAIATVNLESLISFYTQVLSEKPSTLIPNVYAEFQLMGLRLGIFQPKQSHELEFENSTKSKISLCLEVSNLEAAIAHLTNLGYPPPGEISIASHGREIYAYDPDGNRLILHQDKGVNRQ